MTKRETSVGSITPAQSVALAEAYLSELRDTRATRANMPETSYYPALANLFNAVGKTLKPRVRCTMNLKDQGADNPDGGLFTADQFARGTGAELKGGLLPSRGAVEAKSPDEDVKRIAAGDQVRKYLDLYGIILVTNLRDFLIVERGANQQANERESFSWADNEKDFWQVRVAHPRATADEKGQQFIEFIKRACLHNAPLVNPKDVAWFLASYAKDALARVEHQKHLPALQMVRAALEEALGIRFTEEKGEHFFRSTLVQTLFYGIFSAWVLWCRENPQPNAVFDWGTAAKTLHVPFVRSLYWQLAHPRQLRGLNLIEVLEWVDGVLNRVDRTEFFQRFREEHAVQYFYEPFLEAYDPELRKALGVWYTPPELVKYQVARVDAVLREELNLADGLADPDVLVLDPCCGTGTYLVEVLRQIAAILRDRSPDALIASDLKEAAMNRVFGFEILPAPFVVSHLQLGLMLQKEGAPLSHDKDERVGVYLTNALTGWEPPKGDKATLPLPYPELEEERDAAEQVKRKKKILVILGNPPYNAFAGVSPEEEQGLVESYKKDLNKPTAEGGWGIRKFNLDDLYVRFFRLAERRIAEMTGQGVISFISNFSYLSDPSFVVLRQRFLSQFDKFWLDCMNGDSRETGKLTPDGKPDPSVFSTAYNREGIRVGTAVCLIVRKPARQKKPMVRFRHFWGVTKRANLLDSLKAKRFSRTYTLAHPSRDNRLSFRPEEVSADYVSWANITELCALPPLNGLMEKRGGALIDMDRTRLQERMRDYLNADLSWEDYKTRQSALTENAAAFNARAAREKAVDAERFDVTRVCRYTPHPFDVRWCYYTPVSPVWNRARPRLWAQLWKGNRFLIARFRSSSDWEGHPISLTTALLDDHYIVPDAVAIPLRLCNGDRLNKQQRATLFDTLDGGSVEDRPVSNVSKRARIYLGALGIPDPDVDIKTAEILWMHALAIGYSPVYLMENADGIRRDWPRIPLPAHRKSLQASAALGEQLAALLDMEIEVPGVTTGKVSPLLKTVGLTTKIGDGALDLAVTAGWGHTGKGGVVMPAKGKLSERMYAHDEVKAIEAEAKTRRTTAKDVVRLLGEKTCDVYLNETAYWRNIPTNVWDFRVGGYQVIKKWLSYREQELLGRALRSEEAREVTNMARRIAAILLLQPKLDANYQAVKEATYPWSEDHEP